MSMGHAIDHKVSSSATRASLQAINDTVFLGDTTVRSANTAHCPRDSGTEVLLTRPLGQSWRAALASRPGSSHHIRSLAHSATPPMSLLASTSRLCDGSGIDPAYGAISVIY